MVPPHLLPTSLPEVIEIVPERLGDTRGWFCETWNRADLEVRGISSDWVQDNESLSHPSGTLRGIHFQVPPKAQDKLIRVIFGAIFDVAVDLRPDSETFKQHVTVELTAEKGNQLFIPRGFGHAFCTLSNDCRVSYKVSSPYSPEHDRTLRYDDPSLNIAWPLPKESMVLSAKDLSAPTLDSLLESNSLFPID